jgi:hypothetical protein
MYMRSNDHCLARRRHESRNASLPLQCLQGTVSKTHHGDHAAAFWKLRTYQFVYLFIELRDMRQIPAHLACCTMSQAEPLLEVIEMDLLVFRDRHSFRGSNFWTFKEEV